jgi:hypothetical protein
MSKKKKKCTGPKRKLTAAQRRARHERKRNLMIINGKLKQVPRPQMIGGLPVDEFIVRNADSIWLHQIENWEMMPDDDNDRPCTDD